MYRIIGGDGREYGPVAAAQIEQWLAQNRVNGRTMVKPEGAAEWTPLAEVAEFAAAFATRPPPPPEIPPPAVPPATADAAPTTAPCDSLEAARACLGRPWELSVFDTLSRGWEIVTSRFWLTVGATLVASLVGAIANSLPLVGLLSTILFTQVFYGGIYWLLLRVARKEPAEFGDVFGGFTRHFGQLVILSLATFVGTAGLLLVACGPLLWALYRSGVFAGAEPEMASLVGPLLALPVLALPLLYFSIGWIFAPLLVVDRGMGFWEAMETSRRIVAKHWFRMFFLYLAFIPLAIAGLLCFIVGVFVVVTLMYATVAAAYETAFRDPPSPAPRATDRTAELRG